jgi:hypothetical protein
LIFTRYSAVPITHIAPAVVAVFVEAIDAGKLTAAELWVRQTLQSFDRLLGLRVRA